MVEKLSKPKSFLKGLKKLADVIFPKNLACFSCGKELEEDKKFFLCEKCFKKIKFITSPCEKCGAQLYSDAKFCLNCKNNKHYFDKSVSVAEYDGCAKSLIYSFKYGQNKYLSEVFSELIYQKFLSQNWKIDFVTCVALSKERLRQRGFNQSELIAKSFCDKANLTFKTILYRIKNTLTQTHLTIEERRQNLKNAFVVCDAKTLKDQTILVVDDIFTTGATMDEIAKLLKRKGAKKVYGLTFCHTVLNKTNL